MARLAGTIQLAQIHEAAPPQPRWIKPEFGPRKTRKNTERPEDQKLPFRVLPRFPWTKKLRRKTRNQGVVVRKNTERAEDQKSASVCFRVFRGPKSLAR